MVGRIVPRLRIRPGAEFRADPGARGGGAGGRRARLRRCGALRQAAAAPWRHITPAQLVRGTLNNRATSIISTYNEPLITAEWAVSELGRRAKYYQLTAAGRKQLVVEAGEWDRMAGAMGRVMKLA